VNCERSELTARARQKVKGFNEIRFNLNKKKMKTRTEHRTLHTAQRNKHTHKQAAQHPHTHNTQHTTTLNRAQACR
jgi:hypothetical protein